jgi:hypothetical protein
LILDTGRRTRRLTIRFGRLVQDRVDVWRASNPVSSTSRSRSISACRPPQAARSLRRYGGRPRERLILLRRATPTTGACARCVADPVSTIATCS